MKRLVTSRTATLRAPSRAPLLVVLVAVPLASCAGWPPWRTAADRCGADDPPNRVLAELPMERAAAAALADPALAALTAPAGSTATGTTVVVFDGPLRDTELGVQDPRPEPAPGEPRLANVCVVGPDGSTRLLPNVDVRTLLG